MIKLSAVFLRRLRQTPRSQRMRGGKIQEIEIERFDERLVNADDVVPEKVDTTYLATTANTLVSASTIASV